MDIALCTIAKVAFQKGSFSPLGSLTCCPGSVNPSDGMVSTASCDLPGKQYSDSSPAATWYRLHGNHGDGTCRNGDSPQLLPLPPATNATATTTAISKDSSSRGRPAVATATATARPCAWFGEMVKRAHSPERLNVRFSCPSIPGARACDIVLSNGGSDEKGTFANESECVRHCSACAPNPCHNGGTCSAQSVASWHGAEQDGGRAFSCSCAQGAASRLHTSWQYTGETCENSDGSSGGLSHLSTAATSLAAAGGTSIVAVGLFVVVRCHRKRGAELLPVGASLLQPVAESNPDPYGGLE